MIDVFNAKTLKFIERTTLETFAKKYKPTYMNPKIFYRASKKALNTGEEVGGCLVTPVEVFDDVLVYTGKNGWKYYANKERGFYRIANNGSKKWLKVYKTVKRTGQIQHRVKLGGKERNAARLMAKAFIKSSLGDRDVVVVEGEFCVENMKVMTKEENSSRTGKMAKVNKPIAQYENGVEIKRWHSAYDCGKELGFSHQSIRDIISGRYKNNWGLDLRYV